MSQYKLVSFGAKKKPEKHDRVNKAKGNEIKQFYTLMGF